MTRRVFLPAMTGAQQSAIATALSTAGYEVSGSSRSQSGKTLHPVDPETGEGLAAAMAGAEIVVMTLPQDHRRGKMIGFVEHVVRTAKAVGAARIVLNTAGTVSDSSAKPLFVDLRAACEIVMQSGLDWTVLQPTVFLDNLLAPWSIGAIRSGVLSYPAKATARISWISHADLAANVVGVIAQGRMGQVLRIGGPEALTGTQLAAQVSAAMGHAVAYQEIPLDAFAQSIDAAFGPPAGTRIASLYAELEAEPDFMAVDPVVARELGLSMQTAEAFMRARG